MIIQGYKAQSQLVMDSLTELIAGCEPHMHALGVVKRLVGSRTELQPAPEVTAEIRCCRCFLPQKLMGWLTPCRFEARQESIVIEGVHLAPNAVMRLMAKHPSVVPFLVYIRYYPAWCRPLVVSLC